MLLSEKILTLRKKNGWSQEELLKNAEYPDNPSPNGKEIYPHRN